MPVCGLNSTDYRRAARRVRWVHRHDPQERARRLALLARATDAHRDAGSDAIRAVRGFAQQVAGELDGSTLLYSRRLALLNAARRHGIRRFDANLIIAAVQDRAPAGHRRPPGRSSFPSILAYLICAVLIQSTIVLIAWRLFSP
jgi:hypothetical protein